MVWLVEPKNCWLGEADGGSDDDDCVDEVDGDDDDDEGDGDDINV